MSKNYVVTDDNGNYLTPRRATGRAYQARSGWAAGLKNARIFSTRGAAKNSANQNGECTHFRVVPVTITLDEETSE